MGRCVEFFENFDGTPTEIHWTDDHETDVGQEQLLRIMSIADKNSWIMCGSVLKKMKKFTHNAPMGVLKKVGLKNCHSYTVIDVREVVLDNGELEYLVFLRNPTGNFYLKDDEVWKGDWSPLSDKWTPRIRKQVGYYLTAEDIARAKKKAQIEMQGWKEGNNNKNKKKKKKKKKLMDTEVESEEEDEEVENEGGENKQENEEEKKEE